MNADKWLAPLKGLLAPASFCCLACGRRGEPSPRLPRLCLRCEGGIPWIDKPRCRRCGRQMGCPDCARGSARQAVWICNRSAVAYSEEMREWLGRYKYRGDRRFAEPLGRMLERAYRSLAEERSSIEGIPGSRCPSFFPSGLMEAAGRIAGSRGAGQNEGWEADLLVPVPVSSARLEERGFNQALELAQVLARRRHLEVLPLLARSRHTGKQSFKGRAERIADMKQVFVPGPSAYDSLTRWLAQRPEDDGKVLRIVVVDDIYTTGATVTACCAALDELVRKCGCISRLYSLTWARS